MVDVELSGVVGTVSRRRRRSTEERRRVVEETLVAGSSVARVAQRHGVNANQVFQWRRLYRSGLLGGTPTNALKLLPVSVTEDAEPPKSAQAETSVAAATAVVSPVAAIGAIHIELRKGIRVSLEGAVDPALVRAVLRSMRPLSTFRRARAIWLAAGGSAQFSCRFSSVKRRRFVPYVRACFKVIRHVRPQAELRWQGWFLSR